MDKSIYNAQMALSKIGFDIGSIDGIMGQLTAAGLIVYQYYKGIPVTGIVDNTTMQLLVKDVRDELTVNDISNQYIPQNVEKGKGGCRLQDKSYLKKEDLFQVASHVMHKQAAIGWAFMLMNARWEGFTNNIFTICSATRTKTRQTQLWNNKIASLKKVYPSKTLAQLKDMARRYVADPDGGFPHGTGRALDLNLSVGGTNSGDIAAQKKTKDYAWLLKNAVKYGFYNYPVEPWHWEFNPPESKEIPVASNKISVKVNGELLDIDPVNVEGRVLVPARSIAESLGATVEWNDAEKEATFILGHKTLVFCIGRSYYEINGVKFQMDTAATIINDRTFVPVRYLAEAFDCSVSWDGKSKIVLICSDKK